MTTKPKTAVFTFGRFNPPTIGHERLINAVKQHANSIGADHYVFMSKTHDGVKNPLSFDRKIHYAKKAFPDANIHHGEGIRTFIDAAKHLNQQGYKHLVMVAGSDRISEYKRVLHNYNGKEFHFDSIHVVSAGDRDPDAEGVAGMSASKMRHAASQSDFDTFKHGAPSKLSKHHVLQMYHEVRKNMNIHESTEDSAMTVVRMIAYTFGVNVFPIWMKDAQSALDYVMSCIGDKISPLDKQSIVNMVMPYGLQVSLNEDIGAADYRIARDGHKYRRVVDTGNNNYVSKQEKEALKLFRKLINDVHPALQSFIRKQTV